MAIPLSIESLLPALRAGKIAALSRAITLIESTRTDHQQLANELLDAVLPFTGKSIRIGITGVPGVGKSTFIEQFGLYAIEQGYKVAVLAIDPSSSLTQGSILGDKTRMETLSAHTQAFIRPTAAGKSLGGLAYKTKEALLLCEAAGYDFIIVETVGVGQSETEVRHITDFFLLLMLAGAGDELQGIKRGIMELADGLVITKADGENTQKAKLARAEFARAIHFLPPQPSGWIPQVLTCSALEQSGITAIFDLIIQYKKHQELRGFWQQQRDQQDLYAFERLFEYTLRQQYWQNKKFVTEYQQLQQKVLQHNITPYSAIRQLFKEQ